MTEELQPQPDQESKNPNTPSVNTKSEDSDNKENSNTEANGAQTEKCKSCMIAGKIETTQKDRWTIANYISFAALLGSLSLFYVNYRLFSQNTRQFEIANRPNLDMGWVRYVWIDENGPTALTPGKRRNIRFYINNFGSHPVHIYNYKAHFIFDTTAAKIDSLMKEMKSDKYLTPWNVAVPVFAPSGIPNFSQDCIFDLNPTRQDCIKMEEGICTFYLEIEFTNEFSKCWRTYITIITLRDHHGPATLIDLLKYSENQDTSINRPLPWAE